MLNVRVLKHFITVGYKGAAVISTMTGIPLATAGCCCLAASVLNPRACFSAGVLPAYPAFFFVFTSFRYRFL